MKDRTLVFVYGTLRRGGRFHEHFLAEAEYRGAATLTGYRMHDLGVFPAVVEVMAEEADGDDPFPPARDVVRGEVYRVDAHTLAQLDALERHPYMYERVPIPPAKLEPWPGEPVDVYLWVDASARVDEADVVDGGDWLAHDAAARRT